MTTLEDDARAFGFNPSQVRGPDGKWIRIGAAVEHAVHGKGTVTDTHALGKVSVRFDKGGLKKVGGKELSPSGHDPLGGEINEDIIHKRHVDKAAQDDADEEAAHKRNLLREAAERIADTAKSVAGKEDDESGRRMDARQRASDTRHAEHPNPLDRHAERHEARANASADRSLKAEYQRNTAKAQTQGATLGASYKSIGLEGKTEQQVADMWMKGKLQKKGITLAHLPEGVKERIKQAILKTGSGKSEASIEDARENG